MLTVVLRYGKGQRQRMGLDFLGGSPDIQGNGEGTPMEVDGVKAMVAGVKSRGVSISILCKLASLSIFIREKIYSDM